jgi:hypothetical protein
MQDPSGRKADLRDDNKGSNSHPPPSPAKAPGPPQSRQVGMKHTAEDINSRTNACYFQKQKTLLLLQEGLYLVYPVRDYFFFFP